MEQADRPLVSKTPGTITAASRDIPEPVPVGDEAEPLSRESFINRGRTALRQLWKGWSQSQKSRVANLEPDLPEDELAVVRRHIDACLSGRGGQVSARRRAAELGRAYLDLSAAGKRRFFELLSREYKPDTAAITRAAQAYVRAGTDEDRAAAHKTLSASLTSPRLELLKQFNSLEQGIKFLVDLRADLVRSIEAKPDADLGALNDELRDLLASWFDVGFLSLERITWDAPASLLEKLVQYEAVHAIRSIGDLRSRLRSDRRCYAFFHPNMPNEPLIFVEVALLDGIAGNVQDLLRAKRDMDDPQTADTAIFYSISNAQAGLAGVGFGDFLIKRVVEQLTHEFPKLKVFATLSPIPGFGRWLSRALEGEEQLLRSVEIAALEKVSDEKPAALLQKLFKRHAGRLDERIQAALRPVLMRLCARYLSLTGAKSDGRVRALDPVAHFHLSNGARIERLNWRGDVSEKGFAQSGGLMVNYLYKLSDIERNHEDYTGKGQIRLSKAISGLL